MVGAGENEGRPESRPRRSASVLGAFLGAGSRTGGDVMGRNRPDGGFGAEERSTDFWNGPQRRVAESISSETWWCMGKEGGGGVEPTQVNA